MIGMGTTIFLVNPATYPVAGFTNEKSLLFDGVDEYMSTASITEMVGASSFSYSCWFKPTTSLVDYRVVLDFGSVASQKGTDIVLFADGRARINLRSGTATYGDTPTSTFSINNWYNVVVCYDGSGATNADKLKVYVNGSLQSLTFNGTIPTSTNATEGMPLDVARRSETNNYYFVGYVDEVSVFDYTLTASNVTSIYNSGTPNDLDDLATPPIHWWRMGDGSDTISTINDVGTTGGNNGTPTNMESGDIVTDTP